MARGRSKSIVQKIASDTLSVKDEGFEELQESESYVYRSRRSKSLIIGSTREKTVILDHIYPFSNSESQFLWQEKLGKFHHNVFLTEESTKAVDNLKEDDYLNFLDNCQMNCRGMNTLIQETDSISNYLNKLILKYDKISNETQDFDNESTKLIALQQNCESKVNEFEVYLRNFESLEVITKTLSSPGTNLIKRPAFKEMILQLDNSIEFIDQHANFRDVDIYRIRFRKCMTRSLTLIKDYLNNELKKLAQSIHNKSSKISLDLLLFNEFEEYIGHSNFTPMFQEITIRLGQHEEYKGLANDILSSYFKLRLTLLHRYHYEISIKNSEFVQYCQDQISHFKRIIEKEFQLFKRFFVAEEISEFLNSSFYDFSKDLIDPLYDILRKEILKETNISNLCQMSTLFQKYYEFEENEYDVNYGELFQPILNDVQSRLIFRIQVYVDERLIKYKPKLEDLKIGNKKHSDKINILDNDYPENFFEDIYLPLGKALTLLSNIYELINSVVFDDLAHYIVHACIDLLKNEFYKVSLAHLGILETKMNYLKHLIILKTQVDYFDIQYIRNDYSIDFLGGFNDIWEIFKKGEFNTESNGFFELAKRSVPKIINNMIDANQEIETELNNSVNELIKECINYICSPILLKKDEDTPLMQSIEFKNSLSNKMSEVHKKFIIYINDAKIINFLTNQLTKQTLITYDSFYKQLQSKLQHEKISKEISEIMETDELVTILNNLFLKLQEVDKNIVIDMNSEN